MKAATVLLIKRESSHQNKTYMNGQKQSPEVFCKKSIHRNFAKCTGKHLRQSLFFNKVAGGACKFIKKRL